MCRSRSGAAAAASTPPTPCGSTVAPCMAATIRFITDTGAPGHAGAAAASVLGVSDRVTTTDLPAAFGPDLAAGADRDNFKIEINDTGFGASAIPAASVKLEALKPDGTSFAPPRTLQVECRRVLGATGTAQNLYCSRYLRLVVDDVDQASMPDQTLLTDYDPADETVEILGQLIKVSYTASNGAAIAAQAELTRAADRRRIRLEAFILRANPGVAGSGLVTPAQVVTRTAKWYRRVWAQAGNAPQLVSTPIEVDPPANMIVIGERTGANATGNTNNMMRVFVVGAPGFEYVVRAGDFLSRIAQNHAVPDWRTIYNHPANTGFRAARPDPARIFVGDRVFVPAVGGRAALVHFPAVGATPAVTAQAIAAALRTGGLTAVVTVNPAHPAHPRGSADIVVHDATGAMVTLQNETSADTTQTIMVARVNPALLRRATGWTASAGQAFLLFGTPETRALARNFHVRADTVACFVVGGFTDEAGVVNATLRGFAVPIVTSVPAAQRARAPLAFCTFMRDTTMDGTDTLPYTFPHESGHAIMDMGHVTGAPEQMMMGSGTSNANAVGASKRIADAALPMQLTTTTPDNQVTRARTFGASVMGPW